MILRKQMKTTTKNYLKKLYFIFLKIKNYFYFFITKCIFLFFEKIEYRIKHGLNI